MEPCDPGPERAMRQYLTRLLETGTSRSTGCLDRFVQKGMSNFPPQSSALEGKTSRCSLFEQLLSGGSRKSERLLVPDLATEWFRKQKVFLDKLSPEELAALGDGLADKDSKKSGQKQGSSTPCRQQPVSKSGAGASIATQMKDAEESGGKVAACIPTTEPRVGNGNPFLIGNAQAQEMHSKGGKRRRFHWERAGHRCASRGGSCSCLKRQAGASGGCPFQADGQPMASDCLEALRTEPLLPCLRRKFDLRQAPQRRLDPARFRRISPEFFRILASYEAAMSESCPLYGISMHHWGDTEPCCPCGERHPNLKQRFLGDDSVATSVLPPTGPPLESRPMEDSKQPAKKQAEKKGFKSLKEKSEKLKKCCCTNDTCPNECCAVTKGNGKKLMDDSSTSEDEPQEQWRGKQVGKQVDKADGQKVRQVDSGQTAQSSSPSQNRHSERWQGRRGEDQQERQQTNPERRRRFPYCFRRQPQSYRAAYAPSHFTPLSSYPSALPAPASPSTSSPSSLPASSTASSPASSTTSPEVARECQCRHQPRGILSGFTGICKRCIEPGRHLLYNLNANYQQNRERYGQVRQHKKRPFHIASQPAPCSWRKAKGDWNEGIEQGDSSITLRPESLAENRFHSEVIREQANSEQSLPFRTPASERTLAGWNPVQQEQSHLEVAQCQPDCKCALPQQSFQLPPVSKCTFALAEAQQEVLQSAEVTRKSNSELDYLKCGHRVRACYLANDFHQLMKRVARKRPKSKAPVPSRAKSSSPLPTAKAPLRQQSTEAAGASSSERSKIQGKSHSKPIITPKSKPRIMGALLPDDFTARRLGITSSATVKLRSLRKAKKRKQDRERCDAPSATSQDQELPSSSQGGNPNEKTSSRGSSRGTSPKSQRVANPSTRSPSQKRSQKRPSTCSSSERSSHRERSSSGQRWAAAKRAPDTPSISDASHWTQKSREPGKKREQRQRFQSNSTYPSYSDVYASQYSRAWSRGNTQTQSPYRSLATRKAPIQYQASLPSTAPPHLETGRRYYTDTQPGGGEVAASRCSCRSLRSTTSIRALSSNTDSMRCPCAPAPSVASVDPAQELVHVDQGEQQDEHCYCCRYHNPPLDAPYPQPSSTPLPSACRRHKAMLFSEAMRWEPQQHHHARTLLRTQRPPPSPPPPPALLKHQHMVMFPQYPQYHLENAAVQQTPEWVPEYQAPCHYPNNASQGWEDQVEGSPYYTQNNYLQLPESPRHNSYAAQSTYPESPIPGRDRAGAIRAAAQGLRGVVQALGGTRPRSRHHPQLDYYPQRGYSQEQNPTNLEPAPFQNQMRVLHSNDLAHLQAQGAKNHMDEASLYSRPSTATHYENYPLRSEIPNSCHARRNVERDQSTFRMEGGGRQIAGSSSLCDKPEKLSNPTPLTIFFESLRAKHASSAIPTSKQAAQNDSDSTQSSSSDDEADADDSLDCPSQDTMAIPPTYTGLLEEQVLGEYLPSPRCRRRT